jgi:hypothetical protein
MKESLGIALSAGKDVAGLAEVAKNAFVDGLHAGVLVAAGVALLGALVAFLWLPARASYDLLAEDAQAAAIGDGSGPARNGAPGVAAPTDVRAVSETR